MERKNDINNSIAKFINDTKYIFITIVALALIGGVTYILLQYNLSKKQSEIRLMIEKTDENYNKFLTEHPINNNTKEILETDIEPLIKEQKNIIEKYNNEKIFEIQETYYKLGNLFVLQKKYQEALDNYELGLKVKSQTYLISKILFSAASCAEELNNIALAKEYYLRIVDNFSSSIEAPHAQFNLGRIAEQEDIKNGTNTAQAIYVTLTKNDLWKDTAWVSLAKSRLVYFQYKDIDTKNDAEVSSDTTDAKKK